MHTHTKLRSLQTAIWQHGDTRLIGNSVSGVNRTKIAEVTLNALRTRQSLVKGERLVRHEMRAVLSMAAQHNSGRPRTVARAGKLRDNLTQFFLRRCQRTLANAESALLGSLRLIGRLLPKRVCHTQQKCNARGDKRTGPKQAPGTSPPTKNRCEKRATSR